MRKNRSRVQLSSAGVGWSFARELVDGVAWPSRSAAGAIGATGIAVPIAASHQDVTGCVPRGDVIAHPMKDEPITAIVSEHGVPAWRINVPES
jgi:hypothetical protein